MPWIRNEAPPTVTTTDPQTVRDAYDAIIQARAELEALSEPEAEAGA